MEQIKKDDYKKKVVSVTYYVRHDYSVNDKFSELHFNLKNMELFNHWCVEENFNISEIFDFYDKIKLLANDNDLGTFILITHPCP